MLFRSPQKTWMVRFPVLFFNQHAGTNLRRENEIAHKALDGPPRRESLPVRGQGLDLATSAPAGAAQSSEHWLAAHRRAQPRAGLLAAIRTARSRPRARAPKGLPASTSCGGRATEGRGAAQEVGLGVGRLTGEKKTGRAQGAVQGWSNDAIRGKLDP